MKVILLKDVAKIGRKYDVKNVADGYALNFLLPNGLGEIATAVAMKRLELLKKQHADKEKLDMALLAKSLASVSGQALEIREKANDKGHLFAQVRKEEIAKLLKDKLHIEINPEFIFLDKPIKGVGGFEIRIKIHDQVAKLKLSVKSA